MGQRFRRSRRGAKAAREGHETYCRMTAPVDWLAVKELEIRY